jgi:hypothetical protein
MFGISNLVNRWLGSDRIAEMAERVAGRSRLQVWQRVVERLPQLGPTEARGYLRARAIGIVREETARLAAQEGGSIARLSAQIEAAALDLLIKSIAGQLQQRRQVGLRRAA